MAASIDWNDDTIARLRALWDEDHSTAEIGRRMGITKNAVVGKAHRLELPGRESPIRARTSEPSQPRQPRQLRTAAPNLPPLPSLAAPAKAPAPAAPLSPPRRRHGPPGQPCCWPIGEPGRPGFRFCGEGTARGRPYCPEHTSIAYAPRPGRGRPDGGGPDPCSGRLTATA